ncbi:MAG: hypothetical protein KAT70_03525 [Thermoplasmata archaeon]|nr:hypothetical protein [Thermoplasmata archaeon]
MGVEEKEPKKETNNSVLDRAKSDERKWVGVRLSKVMMAQVEETVETHPEWAWSNPNDFVRDAVRRHLEYVRKQDAMDSQKIMSLPSKLLDLVRGMLDTPSYDDFRRKLHSIMSDMEVEKEPRQFLDNATELLASYLGETLAGNIMDKMYREVD